MKAIVLFQLPGDSGSEVFDSVPEALGYAYELKNWANQTMGSSLCGSGSYIWVKQEHAWVEGSHALPLGSMQKYAAPKRGNDPFPILTKKFVVVAKGRNFCQLVGMGDG